MQKVLKLDQKNGNSFIQSKILNTKPNIFGIYFPSAILLTISPVTVVTALIYLNGVTNLMTVKTNLMKKTATSLQSIITHTNLPCLQDQRRLKTN